MPTILTRHDGELEITVHDIETLTGWPDLAGFVVVAVGKTPAPGTRQLRVHMLADTSDTEQVVALLARVSAQLRRDT